MVTKAKLAVNHRWMAPGDRAILVNTIRDYLSRLIIFVLGMFTRSDSVARTPPSVAASYKAKIAGSSNLFEYRSAAPKLGEHAVAVLTDWLGAGAEEIEQLRAAGALG